MVLATSSLVTEASKEGRVFFEQVPCIHYPLYFQENTIGIRALIDSGSEVNAMTSVYASKLHFKVYFTDVGAQIIDGSIFKTFGMVFASFQMKDKLRRARFFQKTSLITNISAEVFLDIPFLTLSNADAQFVK